MFLWQLVANKEMYFLCGVHLILWDLFGHEKSIFHFDKFKWISKNFCFFNLVKKVIP